MTAAQTNKNLAALLKRLQRPVEGDVAVGAGVMALCPVTGDDEHTPDPVRELVYSMLLWEAGASKAATAARRLCEGVVDINELRSCLEDEIVRLIGPRYPRAAERAARLRASLHQIFSDGNTVSMARLEAMSKREARTYLESIEGVPSFVSARVLLVSLGGHAFPLDRRLHRVLADAGAIDVDPFNESAGAWVERQIRAGDALDAYLGLEHAAESAPSGRRKSTPRRKTSGKSVS